MSASVQYKAVVDCNSLSFPCQIGVLTFDVIPPWRGNIMDCDSDVDYYGYTDFEFDLLDEDGAVLDGAYEKLSQREIDGLEDEVLEHYSE